MFTSVVDNYDCLPISRLQAVRLYYQARPLLQYWHAQRRQRTPSKLLDIDLIDHELDQNYIAVDCAGWYFANSTRNCTAIELHSQSKQYWHNLHFEYDYLTWRPSYLPAQPVLAYYSEYFKYCTLDDFLTFCNIWSQKNSKLIVGVDPSKIQFNYLKFDLVDVVRNNLSGAHIRILSKNLFVITT
jgi:hypothetical protein